MYLIIKIIPSLVLGSMLFFSIAIAPKIFSVLSNEDAGKFVRSIFPTYYFYNGLQYLVLVILLINAEIFGEILNLSGTILFLFIISNYLLMPQINKARDKNNQKKFKILHLLSVMVNSIIIVLSLIIIILINK